MSVADCTFPHMGVCLVSVRAEERFDDEEDGWGEVASALNAPGPDHPQARDHGTCMFTIARAQRRAR